MCTAFGTVEVPDYLTPNIFSLLSVTSWFVLSYFQDEPTTKSHKLKSQQHELSLGLRIQSVVTNMKANGLD